MFLSVLLKFFIYIILNHEGKDDLLSPWKIKAFGILYKIDYVINSSN